MSFRNASLSTLLAAVLVSSSAAAQGAPMSGTRDSAPVTGEGLSGGTGAAWLVAAILVVALGIMVFSDDDEHPTSP